MAYTRFDTFIVAGNGTVIDCSNAPFSSFAVQVKGTGAAATLWTAVLEGTLDMVNYTTILTHTQAIGDGVVLFLGALPSPVLAYRARVVSLTLGTATNIVVTILGIK